MPIGFVQGNPQYTAQNPRLPANNSDLGIERLLSDPLLGGAMRNFSLEMYGITANEMHGR
jgi:hypothetical protein